MTEQREAYSGKYPKGYGGHYTFCWQAHLACAVERVFLLEAAVQAAITELEQRDGPLGSPLLTELKRILKGRGGDE